MIMKNFERIKKPKFSVGLSITKYFLLLGILTPKLPSAEITPHNIRISIWLDYWSDRAFMETIQVILPDQTSFSVTPQVSSKPQKIYITETFRPLQKTDLFRIIFTSKYLCPTERISQQVCIGKHGDKGIDTQWRGVRLKLKNIASPKYSPSPWWECKVLGTLGEKPIDPPKTF